MKKILKCKGEFVDINGHKIHIYRLGDVNKQKIVLMAGSATVAPVYDFKVIYEKLLQYFRVIIIEKFGYGYSDICDYPCDIDTLVLTQKQALESVGEAAPFILMPHSMSGLEALRWKQLYPDDISAIIGNDMATPLTYRIFTEETVEKKIKLMEFATKYKLQSLLCCVNNRGLTKQEIKQHKLLRKRNAFNQCYINEAKEMLNNAEIVCRSGYPKCLALLFCSNGKQVSKHWIEGQKEFAATLNARLIFYDCGHYIHHYKSDEMCKEIVNFVNPLEK